MKEWEEARKRRNEEWEKERRSRSKDRDKGRSRLDQDHEDYLIELIGETRRRRKLSEDSKAQLKHWNRAIDRLFAGTVEAHLPNVPTEPLTPEQLAKCPPPSSFVDTKADDKVTHPVPRSVRTEHSRRSNPQLTSHRILKGS